MGPQLQLLHAPSAVQPATQWDQRAAAIGFGGPGPTFALAVDQEAATEPKLVMQRAHHQCCGVSLVGWCRGEGCTWWCGTPDPASTSRTITPPLHTSAPTIADASGRPLRASCESVRSDGISQYSRVGITIGLPSIHQPAQQVHLCVWPGSRYQARPAGPGPNIRLVFEGHRGQLHTQTNLFRYGHAQTNQHF